MGRGVKHQQSFRIRTAYAEGGASGSFYEGAIRAALQRLIPDELFEEEGGEEAFEEMLPLVHGADGGAGVFSLCLICPCRRNVGRFFYEMIAKGLLPGSHAETVLFFHADFTLPGWSEQVYFFAEIALSVESEERELLRKRFALLLPEIRLGVGSFYHANRILEARGLSVDEKGTQLQEALLALAECRPAAFGDDLFEELQHFLLRAGSPFKAAREVWHMCRLVALFYFFRNKVRMQAEEAPDRRFLRCKIGRVRVHLPLGIKQVLGICIGINFLGEHEIFDQRHLLRAIQVCCPGSRFVEDSCFVRREHDVQVLYLEVEKGGGEPFSSEEVRRLRALLPQQLKARVEQLARPLFMPRNEEEVMRHVVALSQELRYASDLPQVVISFDGQTGEGLSFTLIVLRALLPGALPLRELFVRAASSFQCLVDRVKKVGTIRRKYPKEATVLRVRFPNGEFLRDDHSVDLYKARQAVVEELHRVLGGFRDYNGGMIAKQLEVFCALKESLGEVGRREEFLLENFFHSIFPVEMRGVVPFQALQRLFLMILEGRRYSCFFGEGVVCALATLTASAERERIAPLVEGWALHASQLVTVNLQTADSVYVGLLFFATSRERVEACLEEVQRALDF
jgi:hypothetical protein